MSDHDIDHGGDCGHDHGAEEAWEDDFPEPTAEEIFGPMVPAEPIRLQAGPVELWFDPDWAILRRFMVEGQEALRAIYPAVRSAKWKTAPPKLRDLKVETGEATFHLTFACDHVDAETGVDFAWRGDITGTAEGTVRYRFEGAARAAMTTNRTGLCVLHPILPTAGKQVTVTHVDGREEATVFPMLISPHQPFFEVAALTHEVAPGRRARVALAGDIFETEDQRNWTDASFKTYGGALSKPIPLAFAAGHPVCQEVTFSLEGTRPPTIGEPGEAGPVRVTVPTTGTTRLPSVGTRFAPEAGEPDETRVATWRTLAPGHLLVDVDLTATGWPDAVNRGRAWASAIGVPMVLRVLFTPNHQPALVALAGLFAGATRELRAVTVVTPGEPCPGAVTMERVASAFATIAPDLPIAAAPADNFADMNRFRPSPSYGVAPPMCPQVHTFDHQSLMENLEAQPALLATARSFNPHPLLIGPVALLRRRIHDPRQGSLFAAAWTAGSLAAVLPLDLAATVTYHEHDGPMGIPGTPCEGVFEGLAGASRTAPTTVSDPATVAALTVFTDEGARRLLLANLTPATVEIVLDGEDDEAFEFGPYATAWLEL